MGLYFVCDILILLCTDDASYLYVPQTSSAQHLYEDHSWKYIFNRSQDWFLMNSTSKFLPVYYFYILCKRSSSLEAAFGCSLDSEKPIAKYLCSIVCSTVSYRIMTDFIPGHPYNELPFHLDVLTKNYHKNSWFLLKQDKTKKSTHKLVPLFEVRLQTWFIVLY